MSKLSTSVNNLLNRESHLFNMEPLQKRKSFIERREMKQILRPTDYLEARINFKILRDIRERLDKLDSKISRLENVQKTPLKHELTDPSPNGHAVSEVNVLSEIEKLHSRLSDLEKKFEERVPTRVLSEDSFKKEVQDSDEVVNKILSEIKNLIEIRKRIQTHDETLTVVESKRIEKIKSLLKRHEKLSSTELSQLMGLSRTRCNEYFKMMERLNVVKSVLVGKEKFYRLKNF